MNLKPTEIKNTSIIAIRTINAPIDLVFELLSLPNHLDKWFGPNGFSVRTVSMDFKVNGQWNAVMIDSNGQEYPMLLIYREIVPNQKIVYEHCSDESTPQLDRFLTTITLTKQNDNTMLKMEMTFPNEDKLNAVKEFGAIEGLNETLDNLESLILKLKNRK